MSENARINHTGGPRIARRVFPCVPVRWSFLAFHGITDIRESISETHSLVGAATLQEIAIRNEKQLRYAVPVRIWRVGVAIWAWVDEIAPSLRESPR